MARLERGMSGKKYYCHKFSPEQKAALNAALLAKLKERGPLLTSELAEALTPPQPMPTIAWLLQYLRQAGQVWSKKQNRITQTDHGTTYGKVTLWGWINDTALIKAPAKKIEAGKGVTLEDHAWMEYWRQHRQTRQQERQARRHAL